MSDILVNLINEKIAEKSKAIDGVKATIEVANEAKRKAAEKIEAGQKLIDEGNREIAETDSALATIDTQKLQTAMDEIEELKKYLAHMQEEEEKPVVVEQKEEVKVESVAPEKHEEAIIGGTVFHKEVEQPKVSTVKLNIDPMFSRFGK